jgi:hypothetical protein
MASIRKRGEHQWQARVLRVGARPISKTFTSEQAANDWAAKVESEIASMTYVDTSGWLKLTLNDLLNDAEKFAIPGKKEAEQEIYFIGKLRRDPIAALHLPKITKSVMRDYRARSRSPQ